MKCSYCDKRAYIQGTTFYAGYTSRVERTMRPDDLLEAICSHCEGQYETIRMRSMVMKGMGIQAVKEKLYQEKAARETAWSHDKLSV